MGMTVTMEVGTGHVPQSQASVHQPLISATSLDHLSSQHFMNSLTFTFKSKLVKLKP